MGLLDSRRKLLFSSYNYRIEIMRMDKIPAPDIHVAHFLDIEVLNLNVVGSLILLLGSRRQKLQTFISSTLDAGHFFKPAFDVSGIIIVSVLTMSMG